MKQICLYFCVLFSLSSCTKFGKTHRIKGKVLNPITGEGIEGVEIRMYKNKLGLANGSKKQKSVVTDQNGDFDMSKLAFRTDLLSVYSYPGEYYPIGWTNNQGESFEQPVLKMGKTIHADFYAVPYGEMKYTIKNVSCFDETDTLIVFRTYEIPKVFYVEGLNKSIYTGCFEYIGQVYTKYPMGWHYIQGYYKKNNSVSQFIDSIYIEDNGLHEWIFEY